MSGSPNSWVSGKLGTCPHFVGSTSNVIYNNTTDFNYTDNFSYCCWLKQNFNSGAQYAFTVGRADAGGYGYGIAIASATQITTIFGTRRVAVACAANEWHHVAVTVGDGKVKSYVDGSLVNTSDVATVPTYSDGNGLGIGCFHYSGNIYPYYGDLQDFRIYDHCLSVLEVKQISQALLLHYPMTGGGRSGDNLLKYTAVNTTNQTLLGNSINSAWKNLPLTTIDGFQCYNYPKSYSSTGFYSGQWLTGMLANTTYTYSAWLYFTSDIAFNFTSLGHFQVYNGNSSASDKSHEDVVSARIYEPSSIKANTWTKVRITFTTNNLAGSYFTVYPRYNVAANVGELYFRDCKLELGNHPTPWIPHTSDAQYTSMGYNNNIEYDVSGNNYHATITGTVERNSNTARYSTCTGFNSSTYESVSITPGDLASRFTFAWWARNSYEGMFWGFANGNRLNLYMASGVYYWNTGDGSNNPFGISSSTYRDGNWHHYAVTGDGTTVKLYIDGEFKANAKTFKGVTGTSLVLNGWDSSSSYDFNGYLSDFRLYATPLSATQIQELYNTSASISNNGTLMGYEFVES